MAQLRLGILGCGSITERALLPHLCLPDAVDLARIVALCDLDQQRAQRLAEAFGVPSVFSGLETMLDARIVDAVLVATPIPLHFDNIKACLDAGLHVHTQKTLATSWREGRILCDLASERGLRLAVSPGQMLLPAYAEARALIAQDVIGTPYHVFAVNIAMGHEGERVRQGIGGPDPSWYYRPGGGPLLDMGIYSIHVMLGLFGQPTQVSALSSRPMKLKPWGDVTIPVEADDNFAVLLQFERGVLGTLSTAYAEESEILRWGHLSVTGERGSIEVRRSPDLPGQYDVLSRIGGVSKRQRFGCGLSQEHDMMAEAHVYCDVLDFLNAVREDREPVVSAEVACSALAVLDAAALSVRTGRAVVLRSTQHR